jgi:hypothetical protein
MFKRFKLMFKWEKPEQKIELATAWGTKELLAISLPIAFAVIVLAYLISTVLTRIY